MDFEADVPAQMLNFQVMWSPVRLTLELAAITTILLLIVSTPVAWWLARSTASWKEVVAAIVAMPLVLPPTVLGFYLLLAFGPSGPGGLIASLSGARTLAFTVPGLVIASVLYSMPFVVQPIRNAFEAFGDRPLEVSAAPKIKLLSDAGKRQPRPLDWEEQTRLFRELPEYLAQMALFAVNTGCRDQEVCQLRWTWEVQVPELGVSVFIVPGSRVKNGDERLVVLNRIARSVIEARRGLDKESVFAIGACAVTRMMTSAWKRARVRVGLPGVRVHDLKHTFGRRLRAAGVSFEDRQDLLGHRSGRITTHYSAAELSRLLAAAESVVERDGSKPELVVLRGALQGASRKSPASAPICLAAKSLTH